MTERSIDISPDRGHHTQVVGEAVISVRNLHIELPIYSAESRSFKRGLLKAGVGGVLVSSKGAPLRVSALNGISFDLRAGERLGLLGHNGAGKTTLLRALAGVYAPASGAVHVRGAVSNMFDINLGMDPEATGRENIYLLAFSRGLDHKHVASAIETIAEFADLGAFLDLPVKTYSSGMSSRLAFAVATSFRPEILLMDEWISAGDQAFIEKAEARLHDRVSESRVVVLASHDMNLIERVCTRFMILSHGQTAVEGPIGQLRDALEITARNVTKGAGQIS